ncbi:hypothetical protein SeMB42_g01439 [Synchytrium endobioticum]|uniref:Uncharacterized protein n=1 Tax=Synchytrium endobioticum TaxID=286115 RepID=A0A507DLW2_9FUNG|nr:hypothetical protein SeMB42_g01439 [Synchytrium endobioticum]
MENTHFTQTGDLLGTPPCPHHPHYQQLKLDLLPNWISQTDMSSKSPNPPAFSSSHRFTEKQPPVFYMG